MILLPTWLLVVVFHVMPIQKTNIEHIFGISKHTATAIETAANFYHLDPLLVASLAKSESNFDMSAVADQGRYYGAMQVPCPYRCEGLNYLLGCAILKQKLNIAKGNLQLATALYKGGNNAVAIKQAKRFLQIYKKAILLSFFD